jgi:PIN domain nuclease of toxin-antitoxin system
VAPAFSLKRLLAALRLQLLPITPEIALLSRSALFQHVDPADRLIGATALQLGAPLITADARLRALEELETVW